VQRWRWSTCETSDNEHFGQFFKTDIDVVLDKVGFVRTADLHLSKMLRHGRMAGLVKLHRSAWQETNGRCGPFVIGWPA